MWTSRELPLNNPQPKLNDDRCLLLIPGPAFDVASVMFCGDLLLPLQSKYFLSIGRVFTSDVSPTCSMQMSARHEASAPKIKMQTRCWDACYAKHLYQATTVTRKSCGQGGAVSVSTKNKVCFKPYKWEV